MRLTATRCCGCSTAACIKSNLRCIGACGIAPAVSINGKVYPKLTVDMVAPIVEEYRAMGGAN